MLLIIMNNQITCTILGPRSDMMSTQVDHFSTKSCHTDAHTHNSTGKQEQLRKVQKQLHACHMNDQVLLDVSALEALHELFDMIQDFGIEAACLPAAQEACMHPRAAPCPPSAPGRGVGHLPCL